MDQEVNNVWFSALTKKQRQLLQVALSEMSALCGQGMHIVFPPIDPLDEELTQPTKSMQDGSIACGQSLLNYVYVNNMVPAGWCRIFSDALHSFVILAEDMPSVAEKLEEVDSRWFDHLLDIRVTVYTMSTYR